MKRLYDASSAQRANCMKRAKDAISYARTRLAARNSSILESGHNSDRVSFGVFVAYGARAEREWGRGGR
jgi:hypothetical protein